MKEEFAISGRVLALGLGVIAITFSFLTGCAKVSGVSTPSEIDVRTLDVGYYSISPATYTAPKLRDKDYARLEAYRLADSILNPYEVDRRYGHGAMAGPLPDVESASKYLAPQSAAVLGNHRFSIGYFTSAADSAIPMQNGHDHVANREGLFVTVLEFPNEPEATAAASELDVADFGRNPDNVAVPISDYPTSAAHWQPTVPVLSTVIPHDTYVVMISAEAKNSDLAQLTGMVQKYLAGELPMLDRFRPTPKDRLDTLDPDPGNMLPRLLRDSRQSSTSALSGVVLTRHAYLNYTEPGPVPFVNDHGRRADVVNSTQVDQVTVGPVSVIFRTPDETTARKFVGDYAATDAADYRRDVDPPLDVPGSVCYEKMSNPPDGRFRCLTSYHNFAVWIRGEQLYDIQQRTAAQYALLANYR